MRMWVVVATFSSFALSSAASEAPQFKNFPANPQSGPDVPIKWTKSAHVFRARIARAARKPANFAGHYVLTYWGCGSSCVTGVVIDKLTGQIISLPFTICCATPKSTSFKPIEFRLTSRLVVFAGLRNKEPPMGAHFYEFDGASFIFITTVLDDGSFSHGPMIDQQSTPSYSISSASSKTIGKPASALLKVGMQYSEARKLLIAFGWQTPAPPITGYSDESKKVIEECSGDVAMCNMFPEIRNCSGDGYCLMEFMNKIGDTLEVTTYGDLSFNNLDATITGWQQKQSH
jgi:hypothetical protein